MARRLSAEAIRCLGLFEDVTGVEGLDCVIDDDHERVVIVVPAGTMADAVGPEGRTVRRVEERLNRSVSLVEFAEAPEDFVANALRPAAVYDVALDDDGVAHVAVAEADRGVAIGADGRTIELARRLASRHFDVEDIQLVDATGAKGDT
ncbi:MAG: NusA-like transcription termination signal-binding factor [Halobacteriota archaeon]